MIDPRPPTAAVIDFGMGNLFSVRQACETVGFDAKITTSPRDVERADLAVLPGVGAFADAMATLERTGLSDALRSRARDGRAILGVCLGQQLLMAVSHEFGTHAGLGLVPGEVVRLAPPPSIPAKKVPQVGWNSIRRPGGAIEASWEKSHLRGLADGEFMYFVHSYVTVPEDPTTALATTSYGGVEFASALQKGNIFAVQFHPERSGPAGLTIYRNLLEMLG